MTVASEDWIWIHIPTGQACLARKSAMNGTWQTFDVDSKERRRWTANEFATQFTRQPQDTQ